MVSFSICTRFGRALSNYHGSLVPSGRIGWHTVCLCMIVSVLRRFLLVSCLPAVMENWWSICALFASIFWTNTLIGKEKHSAADWWISMVFWPLAASTSMETSTYRWHRCRTLECIPMLVTLLLFFVCKLQVVLPWERNLEKLLLDPLVFINFR